MVPPESERPENEESNSSNLESDAASDVGSSADGSGSFQGEVDEMLNSIEIDHSDADEGLDEAGGDQNAASKEPQISAADDPLMKAGSILNGGNTELPEIELESETESDADEDSLMSMPDPQSLMTETDEDAEPQPKTDESDEGELLAMPDPQSLIQEASAKC